MPRLLLILASVAVARAARAQAVGTAAAPECWGAEDRFRAFTGSMTTNAGMIVEQVGRRGGDPVVQKAYGDLGVCMVTHGFDGERDDRPSRWPFRSDRVILETQAPGDTRVLDVNHGRITYTVNGAVRPPGDAAREWRDNLLGLLDATWDLGQFRARMSSLRGELSAIQGLRSSLEGRIAAYRGGVAAMNGEIAALRGRVAAMQGRISFLRGREGSLRAKISSERSTVSSLRNMSRESARDVDVDARIRGHEDNIQRLERLDSAYDTDAQVRAIERRIGAFDVETRVAAVEQRIRDVDVEAKVAPIQARLDHLEADRRVNYLEDEIRAMDEPARTRDLEQRRDEALARLKRTLRLPE